MSVAGVSNAVADFASDELIVYGENVDVKEIEKSVEDAGYHFVGTKS